MSVHHTCTDACGGQRRVIGSLELELQMLWVLRTKSKSSARAESALNCLALFPVSRIFYMGSEAQPQYLSLQARHWTN